MQCRNLCQPADSVETKIIREWLCLWGPYIKPNGKPVQEWFLPEPAGICWLIHYMGRRNKNTLMHVTLSMCERWCFKSGKHREREEREGWEEVCVSVPLRVPRQGPNVGKVAQCLSHDPWGKAARPLRPRMEMWHQRKCKKGQRTHPHVPIRTS